MKIKTKEDLKNYAIKCSNLHEKLEVIRRLDNLGFKVQGISNYDRDLIFSYHPMMYCFLVRDDTFKEILDFQQFMDTTKQQEQFPDFEVDDEGRVLKINNWNFPPEGIYYIGSTGIFNKEDVQKLLNLGLLFISKEAKDKALFRLEIEQQLRTIASRLNNGEKIDWISPNQNKYFIIYDERHELLDIDDDNEWKVQGTIYCLSENFLSEAIKEIGEDKLKQYLLD